MRGDSGENEQVQPRIRRGRHLTSPRHLSWPADLLTVLLTLAIPATVLATSAGAAIAKSSASHQNWVAHSAYGLQLSVPKSWAVKYFENCPGQGPGTLLIGTPSVYDNCAEIPSGTNIVTMQPETSDLEQTSQVKNLVVHGLHVTSSLLGDVVNWDIRAKGVVLTATGSQSSAVLHTLSITTPRAQAAPGILKGTEYLEALRQIPVTGLVSVVRLDAHGPSLPAAQAYDGQFSDSLPPGTYRLAGHDGNAPCPSVTATVPSGRTIDIPPIYCQGS
jgi:hypothetical protein